ncbi:hypothetical protein [Micromonospora fulviviridis]|uniref:hypothetical protein n=1 Tax=Micromonospora fulviviridis TaxID=47860 RepID=UPI0037B7C03D
MKKAQVISLRTRAKQRVRKPLHPPVGHDVIDPDPAFGQQLLSVATGEVELQVPADRGDDHLGREAEAGEYTRAGGSVP